MEFDFALGDRLDVVIGGHHCVSDLQEVTRSGHLVISAPMYRSMLVPLAEGELFQISYYRSGGMFSFVGRVIRRFQEDGLNLVEVDMKSPISKYQRREFVRLDAAIPVSVRLIALPEHISELSVDEILKMLYDRSHVGRPRPILEGEEAYQCFSADISGGGVCFHSRNKFRPGSLIECTFLFDGSDSITADGQIVRADGQFHRQANWKVSAQFVNVEERIRRKFIKYIFDRQATEHQNGLQGEAIGGTGS